jgi:radical SAM superfamily enzyme YgiQ (UPF0313 family)
MNIMLVNVGQHYPKSPASPPMGIMSLAAWARARISGLHFTLMDQHIELTDYDEAARDIIRARPDVVGLSYMTRAATYVPGMTRAIRAALPGVKILLGGPHPSAAEAAALEECDADALVVGEGEIAFEMVLRRIQEGSGFDDVPGLIHRQADGTVVTNPGEAPTIDDLDTLPFLAYDLLDIRRYWGRWSQSVIVPPRRYLSLFTSRGCPYRCIYCHDVFGKTFRAQSAERMVDEIEHFQKQYGIEFLDFADDIWNLDKQRVYKFSEIMRRRNIRVKITMANGVRTDILTQEVVDAMADAGLYVCGFALETGSRRLQKLIRKNLNIDKFLAGVEMVARKRVFTYGLNMLGFPTETGDEMQMTIDTASNSWLHQAFFFKVTPYPKTALWDAAMENCPERMADLKYANHDYQYEPVVNLSTVSDEELALYARKAIRTFYGRPGRMLRIARDFPKPLKLVRYVPGMVQHAFSQRMGRVRAGASTAAVPVVEQRSTV